MGNDSGTRMPLRQPPFTPLPVKLTTEHGFKHTGDIAETQLEHDELVCHIRTVRSERDKMKAALLALQRENASLRAAFAEIESKWRAVAVEKDERYETDTARLQATISTLELSVAGYRTENEQLVEKVAQMPTLFQRLEGLE